MDHLFSYGTLRDVEVQLAVFSRKLSGWPDALPGYKRSDEKAYGSYPLVVKVGDTSQKIQGMVYTLEPGELEKADGYEGPEYKRIEVDLESGKSAWLYVGA